MTAVAVRQASIPDGGKFTQWVRANLDGEESQAQANVKLADLSYEMPELAVAGSEVEQEPSLDGGPVDPDEDDDAGEYHEAPERAPTL